MALLEQALNRLRDESAVAGRVDLFERLRSFVAGDNEISCGEVATELGLSESAIKSALHRFRVRYRELVREEIGRTVSEPAEIENEIRHLITVMSV